MDLENAEGNNNSVTNNSKNCCCKCFVDDKVCCKSKCCNITYFFFFTLSLLSSLMIHLFDVGSDIYVLIDLYYENLYYFFSCLSIIILSFFISSLINLSFSSDFEDKKRGNSTGTKCLNRDNKLNFILCFCGVLQLGIFYEVFFSLKFGRKTETFIWSRLVEGLLESCPQSLFQLFILMKKIDNNDIINLWKFYLSISLSIVSLAIGLVSFEQTRYDYHIEVHPNRTMIKDIKKISIFSPYGIVLFLYRLTEITSKMVLLSLVGYCSNGFSIIYLLLAELFLIGTVFFIRSSYCKKKIIKNDVNCFVGTIGFMIFYFWSLVRQLFYLAVYWKPFSSYLPGETEKMNNKDSSHWIIKTIMVGIYSYFIVTKLISGYNITFLVLTSIGYSCFIISLILLFFINKWNRINIYGIDSNKENETDYINLHSRYVDRFKPIRCGCC